MNQLLIPWQFFFFIYFTSDLFHFNIQIKPEQRKKNVILPLSLLSRHYSRTRVFATCAQWVATDPESLHADSEYSDQTRRMPRLIRIFAWRTVHFAGFVMLWLICKLKCVQRVRSKTKRSRFVVKAHYFRSPTCLCF